MTRLEAAEMCILRSVKGYTSLDKVRSEVIRKELEISGIQDVRCKHKQRMDKPDCRNTSSRPHLQISREKRSQSPQGKKAKRRCRNSSDDLIHGGRWLGWCWSNYMEQNLSSEANSCYAFLRPEFYKAPKFVVLVAGDRHRSFSCARWYSPYPIF
jgi:hypothetical protein